MDLTLFTSSVVRQVVDCNYISTLATATVRVSSSTSSSTFHGLKISMDLSQHCAIEQPSPGARE